MTQDKATNEAQDKRERPPIFNAAGDLGWEGRLQLLEKLCLRQDPPQPFSQSEVDNSRKDTGTKKVGRDGRT